MIQAISTDEAPQSPKLLSQGIETDTYLFTSGQIHMGTDFKLVGNTIEEKTKKVMSNLEVILERGGLKFTDVVKATIYLTDMSEYEKFNEVYVTYFEDPLPAREVVCVKELPMGADLEISLIAGR